MYATPLSAMKSGGLLAAILFGVVCRADAHDCNDGTVNCIHTYGNASTYCYGYQLQAYISATQ